MWDLLVWRGKHPQAPVTVAAKPHYFSELDMKKTIKNLLKYHPEFFASDQMLKSLESGDITALDRPYFCQVANLLSNVCQLPLQSTLSHVAQLLEEQPANVYIDEQLSCKHVCMSCKMLAV